VHHRLHLADNALAYWSTQQLDASALEPAWCGGPAVVTLRWCSSQKTMRSSRYSRGVASPGTPLPSSYRNKALLIVAATALYTAFLYHSGMF